MLAASHNDEYYNMCLCDSFVVGYNFGVPSFPDNQMVFVRIVDL